MTEELKPCPLNGIAHELLMMANYIDNNPDNAICDTLWHGDAETMRDALLRISGELDAIKAEPARKVEITEDLLRAGMREFSPKYPDSDWTPNEGLRRAVLHILAASVRERKVTLPPRIGMDELGNLHPDYNGDWLNRDDVIAALKAAGMEVEP